MYDLQLAYMVIAHSQRDPGEYMMELQGFASAPSPTLVKHAVDMFLGRWQRALQHLLAAGDEHFATALKLATSKVEMSGTTDGGPLLVPCGNLTRC